MVAPLFNRRAMRLAHLLLTSRHYVFETDPINFNTACIDRYDNGAGSSRACAIPPSEGA